MPASPTITATVSNSTNNQYTISSGTEVLVAGGGSVTLATVRNGGFLVVSGGAETSATVSAGGTEAISAGTAAGDLVYGTLVVTGATASVTSETVYAGGVVDLYKGAATGTVLSGGKLAISGGNTASNTVLAGGGTVDLQTSGATLTGPLTFQNGFNTLQFDKLLSATAGVQGVISGFSNTDKVVVTETGAVLSVVNSGGLEVATVTSGGVTDSFALAGAAYNSATLSWTSAGGSATLTYVSSAIATVTTPTASGAYVEGGGTTLLVSAGGVVSAATLNSAGFLYISGGSDYAAVINAGGWETVAGGSATGDLIYGALVTVSGTAGVLTSETVESGGVFTLGNGASASGTVVSSGGVMVVSGADAAANDITLIGGGMLNLASPKAVIGGQLDFSGGHNVLQITGVASAGYGEQAIISGFTATDAIDIIAINATGATLTVASSGGAEVATVVGGGNSESFIFSGTATYTPLTLSLTSDASGHAEIVYNPNAAGVSIGGGATSTGLTVIGGETLTVQSGGAVASTVVQSGGSLVVSGLDTAATVSVGGAETVFGSASGDQIFGGVTVAGVASGEMVSSGGALAVNGGANSSATISQGAIETVTNGGATSGDTIYGSVTVNGGSLASALIENGGSATISAGVDTGSTILAGGSELVLGSATGDQIHGVQLVSAATAVVTSETVYAGGEIDLFLKGGVASATVVSSGGQLKISGNATAIDTVLSGGGVLVAESPKVVLSGSLTFAGGANTFEITGATSAGFGDMAVNSGFSATDRIDLTAAAFTGSSLTLSQSLSGGDTVVDVISGGSTVVEAFTFAGASLSGYFQLISDGAGGEDLVVPPVSVTTPVTTPTASGAYTELGTDTLLVQNGGVVSAATVDSGGRLIVDGGSDHGAIVLAGGAETVSSGAATGDQIYGSAIVSGGAVSGETVLSGGRLDIVAGGSVADVTLSGGGLVDLASPSATLTGVVTFAGGGNTLEVSALSLDGAGDQAVLVGFSSADKIDVAVDANLSFSTNLAGQSVATITGDGGSESFVFSDPATYNAGTMSLISDGAGGVDLILDTKPVVTLTSLGGATSEQTNSPTTILNGTVDTAVDPEAIGTTVSVLESSTVVGTAVVGADGHWAAKVTFLNDSGANVLSATDTDVAGNTGVTSQSLTYNVDTAAAAFTAGDLVISISGNGDGSGSYADNAASPVTLEEITVNGTFVDQIVLPQTTTVVNGVTEYAISSEYGSQSEGSLQLSQDGHSLVIAGYGVNDATYNNAASSVYGGSALAQSSSIVGGPYVVIPRVVADINANGVVDTSTGLTGVFNENNPRSVATIDGRSFYLSGQGIKGDATQGVWYAQDGAVTATNLYGGSDTRTAEIFNGELYVSVDSKGVGTNISDYGALPTGATSPMILKGIDTSITLTAATANTANVSAIGSTVNLSPENFFFANADTLYVADSGNPKNGGIGDGGLQKWVFDGTQWNLQYTLSAGLNLVPGTAAYGTSGLIGLAGKVVGGTVQLYATSYNLTDIEPTHVYAITDTLSATTSAGESFTTIFTAAPGSNVRGISFAPTAYAPAITGAVAGQTTASEVAIKPFATVTITDPNTQATETLTITVGGVGGALSGAGLEGGAGGVYTLTGAAAAVTAELQALSFVAAVSHPNTASTSTFTLSDTSSANATPTTDGTTTVTDQSGDVICFYPGTLIATPDGPRPVETLAVGDLVLTHEGAAMPVRWMGRQTVSTRFGDPLSVLPIRIRAGALGECTPQRDLLVSACHALLVGDVLVQAGALVNGVTITREADVPERFTYHHVELSDHSLILAEGVPAETFIENVEGRWFDNWAERPAFEGRFAEAQELAYPRVQSARQLPAALRGALGTAAADLEQARAVDRPLAA